MKRNCNGCRASNDAICSLGKKVTFSVTEIFGYRVKTFKPMEECLKPKTYVEYLRLIKKG